MDVSQEKNTPTKYNLSDNVEFYIGDSLNIPKNNKFSFLFIGLF